jgi:bacterioferritin-associated ferredoxin
MKLPSGGAGYPEGALDLPDNGELPIYPMTAIDEITARTPDALFNGTAVVELIRSCVPNIKDPWAVTNVDLDALLVAIKAASSPSGEMDVESQCPKCEDVSTFKINLAGVLNGLSSPNFDAELDIGDLSVKFRPLSFKEVNEASIEQFELQRLFTQLDRITDEEQKSKQMQEALARITSLTMTLLSKSIVHITTPTTLVTEHDFILDFLQHCDRNIYIQIRDFSSKIREESEIKPMQFTCASCSHQYEQSITLNATDFFD